MSGNGRTRVQEAAEDMIALAMDMDEAVGRLVELADKDGVMDMKDDPFLNEADKWTKMVCESLDIPTESMSYALRARQAVLRVKELDWGHMAGLAVREALYPQQKRMRACIERLKDIRGKLDKRR